MAVEWVWLDAAHSIIGFSLRTGWTDEAFDRAIASLNQAVRAAPHRVDLVYDLRHVRLSTADVMRLTTRLVDLLPTIPLNVAVGMSAPLRMLILVGQRARPELRGQVAFARDVEEALVLIARDRAAPS
jgi:hypothetical protein